MTKAGIRELYLHKRLALTATEVTDLSALIAENFFSIDLRRVRILHTFLPIRKSNEPDTWQIIDRLRESKPGISIAIPKVLPNGRLEHHLLGEKAELAENRWGIPESKLDNPVLPNQIDLVVTPLVAFDTNGFRIGYGKGYYDRFLAECRNDVQKVGLSFFDPIPSPGPEEWFDQRLGAVVTPRRVFTF